ARILEQRLDDCRQRIEAECGELRLLGGSRPRGPLLGGELVKSRLVQLAVHTGGLVLGRGLVLVEDLGRQYRSERDELLERCLDAFRRQPGADRKAVEGGDAVEDRKSTRLNSSH